MESRKSARLQQDSSELHHLQLQYVQPLPSPNIIRSHVSSSMIDVPDSMLRNRCVMNCTQLEGFVQFRTYYIFICKVTDSGRSVRD